MAPLERCDEIRVGIAEWKIAQKPQKLITLGLGSCVGVALLDGRLWGGLAHVMLPDSTMFKEALNPDKFADLAVPAMFNDLLRRGVRKSELKAKLVGGAQMFFSADNRTSVNNIGQRNVLMCQKVLQELGVPIISQDVGGNRGRTMIVDTLQGQVLVRTIGEPVKTI
jgi:chemotaxis protein CheD